MHDNEQEVNTALVQFLLKEQCPQWADLELIPILSSGTDNALFRLGETYVVRIPRLEWSPGSVSSGINKEYLWVPQLAQHLKIPISEPVFKGTPNKAYPWPWSITKWNDGHNPEFEKENEYDKLAVDLAHFLNELHSIKLPETGPFSRWSFLNANSRAIFRKHLVSIDEHTWERGKGWALSIALIILPYYKNTNPVLTSVARRIIAQLG